jgi:hypothetical protein
MNSNEACPQGSETDKDTYKMVEGSPQTFLKLRQGKGLKGKGKGNVKGKGREN